MSAERLPLFRQIAERIRTEILDGSRPLGSRMPTVRAMAAELKVARQTVVDAYAQLAEWGLTHSHVGRDTRVVRELPGAEAKQRLQDLLERGPMADFETISASAGLRSLATAVPDPHLFPADEFLAHLADLKTGSPWSFYYAPPAGIPELRDAVADLMRADGLPGSDFPLITLGATHALALVVDALCPTGSTVVVESPGFLGQAEFFKLRGITAIFAPSEPEGIDLVALERILAEHQVRMLLVWPSFGGATGGLCSLSNRKRLIEMAEARHVFVVEDAHYRRIAFTDQPLPLRALSDSPHMIHLDGLSGCLAPGLRTGWVCADATLLPRLEQRVRSSGTAGLAFVQTAVARFLREGFADHLSRAIPRYRARRDALRTALSFDWPKEAYWSEPRGGLSFWIHLPEGGSYDGLYEEALQEGVPFAPGRLFGSPSNYLRASYGTLRPEAILEAGATLGRLVSKRIA